MTDDLSQTTICLDHVVKRFMEAVDHAKKLATPKQVDNSSEIRQKTMETEQSEILFIVRLAQARNWAKALKKCLPDNEEPTFISALLEFTKSCQEVYTLRDFNLHEDDYLLGKGRQPDKYKTREPAIPGFQADGLSTIRFENVTFSIGATKREVDALHLIGGNVSPIDEINKASPHFEVLFARWVESNQVTNHSSD